jgi:hypothetical protein
MSIIVLTNLQDAQSGQGQPGLKDGTMPVTVFERGIPNTSEFFGKL